MRPLSIKEESVSFGFPRATTVNVRLPGRGDKRAVQNLEQMGEHFLIAGRSKAGHFPREKAFAKGRAREVEHERPQHGQVKEKGMDLPERAGSGSLVEGLSHERDDGEQSARDASASMLLPPARISRSMMGGRAFFLEKCPAMRV